MDEKEKISTLFEELFPIHRSLTGDGTRESLEILSDIVPLEVSEVPSGKQVYDWQVPPEWNIKEAWIKDESGRRIIDIEENNLHILQYSEPIHEHLHFEDLEDHLYTLPDKPDTIPYRTSYYERDWGFCLRHEKLKEMDKDASYEVCIKSEHNNSGSLTYADARVRGESDKEYIISTYCCHPSLANDNLSGLILAPLLFNRIQAMNPYHSYRLIIVPETIGAISYLYEHEEEMKSVDGGYVVTTAAGPGSFGYKESFVGDHPVDIAANLALQNVNFSDYEFAPTGSDERQYSTPGFRIPTGTITKNKYYEYDEYHTSDDDLSYISPDALKESLNRYWEAIQYLEMNRIYERYDPHCEFKLDQHGLHPTTGGQIKQPGHLGDEEHESHKYDIGRVAASTGEIMDGINWLMFGCDGKTSLFELAERSGMDVPVLFQAAQEMQEAGLLNRLEDEK